MVANAIITSVAFQKDDAPCHYATIVQDKLNVFQIVGLDLEVTDCLARASGLNRLDFINRYMFQSEVCQDRITFLNYLHECLRNIDDDNAFIRRSPTYFSEYFSSHFVVSAKMIIFTCQTFSHSFIIVFLVHWPYQNVCISLIVPLV